MLAEGQAGAEGYATSALQGPVCSLVVPAAIQGNVGLSNAANAVIANIVKQTRGASGRLLSLLHDRRTSAPAKDYEVKSCLALCTADSL